MGRTDDIELRYIDDIGLQIGKLAAQLRENTVVGAGEVADPDEGKRPHRTVHFISTVPESLQYSQFGSTATVMRFSGLPNL